MLWGLATGQALAQTATGSTSHLLLFLQGRQIGSEQSTVRRTAEGWQINGSNAFGPPIDVTAQFEQMRYDENWHPIELRIAGVARGAGLSIQTTFSGTTATNEVVQLGQPTTKIDQVSPDAIVIPNPFFATYEALSMRLAAMQAETGTFAAYVAPQAEIRIDARRLDVQVIETTSGTVQAHRYALTFNNPGAPLDGEVWTDPSGRLLRVEVPAQSLTVVRDDIAAVSSRRQSITREGDQAVVIQANGFNLAGTVSKPSGQPDEKGRYPAILLIAGSGPQDRDENVAGIPVFGQLAGALADAGYLVLRYDKRGVGQSGGRAESATLTDYAEDARFALEFLGKRKDVDGDRITIAGHSEGGWVALLTASRREEIAAVVLIATPGGSGADLVLEQQAHLLSRGTLPPAERQARIDLQKKIQAAVLGKGPWTDIPANLRTQADTEWFRSFLAFSPATVMPKVRQPILIVEGERDTQVPPAHADSLAALARQRKKSAPDDVAVVKLPGVNHLLVQADTGEVSEYASLTGRKVDPAVAKAIADFLRAHPKK